MKTFAQRITTKTESDILDAWIAEGKPCYNDEVGTMELTKLQFEKWYKDHESQLAYPIGEESTGYTMDDIPETGTPMSVWEENGKYYFEW